MGRKKKDWPRDPLPVGTIKLRTRRGSSVRYIKCRMDGPKQDRWKPLARWTWEQTYGPVPRGMVVAHLDGNRLHDELSNYGLRTPGQVAQICHQVDPAMSARNRRAAGRATARHNVDRALVAHGRREFATTMWYAVDVQQRVIFTPWRRERWRALAAAGIHIEGDANGARYRKFAAETSIRVLTGAELRQPEYQNFTVRELESA